MRCEVLHTSNCGIYLRTPRILRKVFERGEVLVLESMLSRWVNRKCNYVRRILLFLDHGDHTKKCTSHNNDSTTDQWFQWHEKSWIDRQLLAAVALDHVDEYLAFSWNGFAAVNGYRPSHAPFVSCQGSISCFASVSDFEGYRVPLDGCTDGRREYPVKVVRQVRCQFTRRNVVGRRRRSACPKNGSRSGFLDGLRPRCNKLAHSCIELHKIGTHTILTSFRMIGWREEFEEATLASSLMVSVSVPTSLTRP